MQSTKIKIVSISGNIGSGKTSLIETMNTLYPTIIQTCEEPLNKHMLELLNNYYISPLKYCFEFQYELMLRKFNKLIELVQQNDKYKIILLERSFETDYECFFIDYWIKTRNAINQKQIKVFETLYHNIKEYMKQFNHVKINLQSPDINVLLNRISERGRPGEELLDSERLKIIENSHYRLEFDKVYIVGNYSSFELANDIKKTIIDNWFTYDGQINLITGPMFSGKTTTLIKTLQKKQDNGNQILCIKYNEDIRENEGKFTLQSHDKLLFPAISASNNLVDTLRSKNICVEDYDVIGIDEGQFYDDILIIAEYCANIGKTVYITTLSGTFSRSTFNPPLISICDNVKILTATCSECGAPAAFSKRIVPSTELIVVGGISTYLPVCRKCYFN